MEYMDLLMADQKIQDKSQQSYRIRVFLLVFGSFCDLNRIRCMLHVIKEQHPPPAKSCLPTTGRDSKKGA
jgi:hypothetical protein